MNELLKLNQNNPSNSFYILHLDYRYIEVISVIHFTYSNYPFKFSLLSGSLVAREPIKAEIGLTIQQAKNSNNPKLKQQALDLERKIQEQENAKLQKEIQKINNSKIKPVFTMFNILHNNLIHFCFIIQVLIINKGANYGCAY